VTVITGATGHLGRVVARRFAEEGARLALLSTNPAKLAALASELRLPEDRWLARALDLRKPEAAAAAREAVLEKFGRADILVHLVGGWVGGKTVTGVPAQDVAEMLQQHFWTTLYLTQVFVPHFVASGWGRVMAITSPQAALPAADNAAYAIGKAAQETLMTALAEEVKGSGVTANVLRVRTIDAKRERSRSTVARNATGTIPEEIASAILYLCSDEAEVVNGARIPLYGSS
jgi:NAD(P)-dependent dehydrogenase (short-subunit alcohol dehydrogenase family)